METNKITSRAALFCGVALMLTSCVKDDIDNTPHPSQGAIVITTDWSSRADQAVQPVSYTLRVSGQSGQSDEQPVKGNTNIFHSLLAPAAYELLVYNTPEAITVTGDVATIASTDENNIELSGIASSINLATGAWASPTGVSLSPVFEKTEEKDGTPTLTATIRLLGIIAEEKQELSIAVALNNQSVYTIKTDLTEVLQKCFDGSMTPLVLGANFDLPSQGDFSGNINSWNSVEGGHVDIH